MFEDKVFKKGELLPEERIGASSFGPPPKVKDPKDMSREEKIETAERFRFRWDEWSDSLRGYQKVPIYDGDVPDFDPDCGQEKPGLYFWLHWDGKPHGMVVTLAGGGQIFKAVHEGVYVAEAFYQMGFNTAVLDYRCIPYTREVIQGDARRAVRYIRCHAGELNTYPDKIALMGFSGGGNLAGITATRFDYGNPEADDPVEQMSSRPDAVIIGYSFSSITYPDGVLNYNREEQKRAAESRVDANIRPDCPPFFIWQCAGEDDPRGICNLAMRLGSYGVPFEMHVFPYGQHGLVLADGGKEKLLKNRDDHVAHWVELCREWLYINGF